MSDPESPKRPSPGLLAGVAGAVVVLAAVGATGGWLLAGSKGGTDTASGEPSPSAATGSTPYISPAPAWTTPTPAKTKPTKADPAPPGAGQFALPDVTGTDFRAARLKLRELRLGVVVVFGEDGEDNSVERTTPEPDTTVKAGITVKLHVRGKAPALKVPDLGGTSCAAAGRQAAEQGLTPRYVPAKVGSVMRQEPLPSAEAYWNDALTLYCATASS